MTGTTTAAITAGGNTTGGSYVSLSETWDGTSWTETSTDINVAKMGVNGKGTQTATMIAGGETTTQVAQTELFDGSTWTEVADMAVVAYSVGASGGTNSGMLACGGSEGPPQAVTDLVEEWNDPVYTNKTVTVS